MTRNRTLRRLAGVGAATTVVLATASSASASHEFPGDVNHDGVVNFSDLEAHAAATDDQVLDGIVANWGKVAPRPEPDPEVSVVWGAPVAGTNGVQAATPAGDVGDELFLAVVTKDPGTVSAPSGWDPVYARSEGGVETTVFHRTATQAGSGNVSVGASQGSSTQAVVFRTGSGVEAVDLDTAVDSTRAHSYSATGTTMSEMEVGDVLIGITGYGNDTSGISASMTENGPAVLAAPSHPIKSSTVLGSDITMIGSEAEVTGSGESTVTLTASFTGGDPWGGTGNTALLVLRSGGEGSEPTDPEEPTDPTDPEEPNEPTDPPPTNNVGALMENSGRPFAANGPWNTPLPASPQLDPNSAAMVNSIDDGATANIYAYADPVFTADSSDPMASVNCTQPWGTCGPEQTGVRLPSEAQPTNGSDGRMIIVDLDAGTVSDFWQADRSGNSITASWATTVALSDYDGVGPQGGATGGGINALAGVIRTFEARAATADPNGYTIPHALSMATGNSCSGDFRYPASKTDGQSGASDCVPEGARLQLDPSINVNAIPGITPIEKAIARTLQTYGVYNRDNCGGNLCLAFEGPIGESDPYPAAGIPNDYWNMPHIPWDELRVVHENVTQAP